MNRQHYSKFSDRPFKSCEVYILCLLEVKPGPPSAQTVGKLLLPVVHGYGNAVSCTFTLRLASPKKQFF
jgi:hypothetical protein